MKSKLLLSLLLVTIAGAAGADTFIVPSEKGTTSDEPKLVASHKGGTCVYGDKEVQLGDTVIMAESEIVLVCANAPQGPVFYPLSSVSAKKVMTEEAITRAHHVIQKAGVSDGPYGVF
jgi:hypothetical protein